MSERDTSVLLAQMQHAAQRARVNVEGLSREDFLLNETAREATLMNLLQIGEMAMRLARDHSAFVALHADLPVSQMRGMRNRIAHGYFLLDNDTIWQTVTEQIPDLLTRLNKILDNGKKTHGQS
jgi:uncharacterized protein with HEPN domain